MKLSSIRFPESRSTVTACQTTATGILSLWAGLFAKDGFIPTDVGVLSATACDIVERVSFQKVRDRLVDLECARGARGRITDKGYAWIHDVYQDLKSMENGAIEHDPDQCSEVRKYLCEGGLVTVNRHTESGQVITTHALSMLGKDVVKAMIEIYQNFNPAWEKTF